MTSSAPREVPAPWMDMKAEGYSFAMLSRARDTPPSSAYDPLERQAAFSDRAKSGHFAGGIGLVMIVRYKDSPCGPYDELLVVPGSYEVPPRGSKASWRITRIYVSTAASTYNGRRNWNIPKRIADFTFVPREDGYPGYSRVEVRLPGAEIPFFAADFSPTWLSSMAIPINSRYLPIPTEMVQPPLPKGDEVEREGTDKWMAIDACMRGKCSPVWAAGGLKNGEWTDGKGMPPLDPISLGVFWPEFYLDFPEATDPRDT